MPSSVAHGITARFSNLSDNSCGKQGGGNAKAASAQSTRQSAVIEGVIKDADGAPIVGATVAVKGSAIGALTDAGGHYILNNVPAGSILSVSYVGMKPQEITVGNAARQTINVKMEMDAIDEVVVVAFGTQKKESIVSSIETINPKELKVPSSNLTTALAGRMSGVIAYQRSGEPGADGADFFIRGVTSFGYKVDPLILIDGIESTKRTSPGSSPTTSPPFRSSRTPPQRPSTAPEAPTA